MPIYEYRCESCGHELEAIQKFSDAPLTECPSCETSSLKKLISAAAFRLKGGGWYETDFKQSDKKRNLAGDDSKSAKSESKADAKSDKKSDSKPDKKADPKPKPKPSEATA